MNKPLLAALLCLLLSGLVCAAEAQSEDGKTADFSAAANKVRDAVVTVTASDRGGAGFIVNPEGYILTNKHVVDEAKTVTIKLRTGDELNATVQRASLDHDLCLLKVDKQHLPTVQFASSSKLKQGADVAAVGAPFGLSNTLTKGVISATDREIEGQKYVQLDAALNQGNSGGPVINSDGQVIAMATKAAKEAQNVGFAIPSDDIMAFLNDAGVSFEAGLGEAPAKTATAPAPATEAGAVPAPVVPAAPSAPPSPQLLQRPLMILILAAVIAFIVALVTTLILRRGPAAQTVYTQQPAGTFGPPPVAAPLPPPAAGQPRPAAPPAAPPAEDLSDIDIELR